MIHKNKHESKKSHKTRNTLALGVAVVAVAIGGTEKGRDIVSNANAAHGRAVPTHPVTIENAGGHLGGTMVVMQGNVPAEQAPATKLDEKGLRGAVIKEFEFEAVGNNNLQAMIDTFVPDEDITEARNAADTYLPVADRANHTVYPAQHLRVVVKDGKIIPKDQLPTGYLNQKQEPIQEIGTAIHTEIDDQGREVTIEGYQDGHTTTTVNPG